MGALLEGLEDRLMVDFRDRQLSAQVNALRRNLSVVECFVLA